MGPEGTQSDAATGGGGGLFGPPTPPTNSPYGFIPSFPMNTFGATLFTIMAVILNVQYFRYKHWYFGPVPQAALMMAAGLWARVWNIIDLSSLGAFVFADMITKIAPIVTMLGIVQTFKRDVLWVTPTDQNTISNLWFPERFATIVFAGMMFLGDFFKQLTTFVPVKQSKFTAIGQIIQLTSVTWFLTVSIRWFVISRSWPSPEGKGRQWRKLAGAVAVSAAILFIRQIFVVVQTDGQNVLHADGKDFFRMYEWVYWAFEFLPTFLLYVIWAAYPPATVLPHEYTRFRLRRKLVLASKPNFGSLQRSASSNSGGLVISSPRPTQGTEDKFSEFRFAELEMGVLPPGRQPGIGNQ
ncbi:hypothetical protein K402DRAFT_416235 [Aulographum hederae CBS 113979]|uniref:RTA1-domain-containing protein n=1 Tax=Aulographum hederae CBS 113979 TaxID=1176131 RepID=A0A6G1HHT6_9PEZI|nr:hypothetical protein K402DRAFT_416235 [Aulographum hederae CBS 113979]